MTANNYKIKHVPIVLFMKRKNTTGEMNLQSVLFRKLPFIGTMILVLFSHVILAQTTFTGAVNNNWNNAGNWSSGIPSGATAATIPSGFTCNMLSGDAYSGSGAITLGGTFS